VNELINYNATLNLGNEKSNLDAVIGSTNSLVPASDKINNINSVNNSVTAKDSATTKDILPSILDLKSEEINNVILPDYSTPKTSIFSNDLTSKSSTSDTGIDSLTGLKVNEAVIDNSKPDSLTNPSASQSQTLNNTEQLKENVTPATSESKTPDTSITSTENKTIAPAIEKPSVSVEETSPVTDKAAVTSESEDKAIASLDTGSTTPVSSVVTNNNSGAIASEVSKSDTPVVTTSQNFTFNMGVFKVDETGKVGIDYLFDGGGYEGELGIFNLDGMENLAQNSDAFITEAARRAVSNSNLGYVVINDATEGARFNGDLPYDIDRNRGEYKGVKTFTMLPGDKFAFILVPNGANLQQVANKSAKGDDARPLFSLPIANPNGSSMTGQIADVTGVGNTFVMEDLRVDKSGTDSDYNDIIFQVRGATGSAVSIDSVINPNKEWRSTNLGKALIEYAKPYVTPENPKVGELVTDELYDSIFGNTDNQVDNPSKTGAIAPEVPKSDSPPVTTAPATSDPAKTESNATSTNSGAIAPAIEKPSFSVEETSPVTAQTAVISDSENKAIAPLDSGSTTPVSSQQPVVTTESSSSFTGDEESVVSDTPKNLDSAVVTNNNSGAIAAEVSKSDTPVVTAPATSDPAKTETEVTSTNSNEFTATTQNNNSASNTQPTVVETVANKGEEIGAIASISQDNNSTSTTKPTVGETAAIESEKVVAIAPTSQDNNSTSTTQPTLGETVASEGEVKGASASTSPDTNSASILQSIGQEPVVARGSLVDKWVEEIEAELATVKNQGSENLNSLHSDISNSEKEAYSQMYDLWSNLSSTQEYLNSWTDYAQEEISRNSDYMNSWVDYLGSQLSNVSSYMYDLQYEVANQIDNKTNYMDAWVNYLGNQVSNTQRDISYWIDGLWNQLDNKGNQIYAQTNYLSDRISSQGDYMYEWLDSVRESFNNNNVGDDGWNRYHQLVDYTNAALNDAWSEYNALTDYSNEKLDNAWSEYNAINNYAQGVTENAWSKYDAVNNYTYAAKNWAWNQYNGLDEYRSDVISDAWDEYYNLEAIVTDAWNQYNALVESKNATMDNAWSGFVALDEQRYQTIDSAWNQYSDLLTSWNDSTDDTQAQIDVWAKIAKSENFWNDTTNDSPKSIPLVGIIDTGFRANNPDIDFSRITLGKDWVDGDDDPLLQPGEGDEHGTQMLEIVAATRNNGIGINGINDKSPLWLGRAVGSNDWAQSLIEYVDAVKQSDNPNAIVNLSFDLTQTNADGSVTTRSELTSLERAALTYAQQNNVLIVAATGNQGSTMSALGQAVKEFDNIFVVGAAEDWSRADYSSYGEVDYDYYGKGVDILAQGNASNGASGTSVAAAKVTGAVSLVWAANPSLNYTQVMDILRRTATDLNTPAWDAQTGLGLLNIAAAVHLAKATEPEAYSPPALALIQDTLKDSNIPQVYWPEFYQLYYYYDLEAKLNGPSWSGVDAIATERATGGLGDLVDAVEDFGDSVGEAISDAADYVSDNWDWGGAGEGALIGGALGGLGGATLGAIIGGLTSGRASSFVKQVVTDGLTAVTQTATELGNTIDAAVDAVVDLATEVGNTVSDTVDAVVDKAAEVGGAIDAAVDAVVDTASDIGEAIAETGNKLEQAADYVGDRVNEAHNAVIGAAVDVGNTLKDAGDAVGDAARFVGDRFNEAADVVGAAVSFVGDRISKSIDDLKKQGKDFKEFLDKNNPVKKLADDLAAKLKSSLDGIDVGAVLDVLKKIPVVGTVVNGIEGLIALIGGDWKQVVKNAINGVLGIIPGGSAVPEKLVNILVDVGWGIINKDYKTALKDILKELEVKDRLANTFVDVAWAMKDGDWKDVLSAGLSGAGLNNAEKFVDIAWAIKDGDYKKALSTGLSTTGFPNADKFVDVAWAVKDGDYEQALSAGLETAGLSNAGTFVGNVFDAITDDYSLPGQSIDPAAIPEKHKLYEYLARGIAYEDPEVSAIAEDAFKNNSLLGNKLAVGEDLNSGYKVDKVISDPNTGFYAVGLVSKDGSKPPVLAVRGTGGSPTERKGIAVLKDVLEDANPISIGYSQFQANKNEIEAWLAAQNQQGRRPDVVGHSLGGALAQTIAAEFTDKVGQTVTFNSPGIDDSIALKFALNGGKPENVTHYVVSGDIVQMAGEAFLPGQAVLSSYSNPFVWEKHGLSVLNGAEIKGEQKASGVKFSSLSVLELSNPAFQYKELDYTLFLAALGLVSPYVSTSLSTRGTAEANRKAIGAFLNSNFQTIQSWVDAAWSIKDGDYLKALSTGFDIAKFQDGTNWIDMVQSVKEGDYLKALSTGFDIAKFQDGKKWVDMAWSLQQGDYLKALSTGFKVAGFPEGEHLAQAAVNLREGKYLDAFFEGMYMVPGVEDLVNAFKAVGDGNFKGVAKSLTKVVTNPTLLKLLVS